ncbi:PREDICTED: TGF-beta-activated kinase 1 and MAP3K7-binding protein 1-like [Amphimedon queenslandica]|uniref:PPM-type phosphatase domain-containing protein n=1 Tax=Amphimedon queenslandica TaxID=400682 RepID=A0A1X7UTA1_AMPQE|nr:PREDICTED: TGF-beta-activated kinase 1 and MAP3K7-binding protein 1-like [Amphimedon queenslandica]|eukprot:XP_003386886.1 PREDICTED: TGF-beta-activated kinase 1 and MAP3K7-binding protein 1-like [Amphimedon queenslandica]
MGCRNSRAGRRADEESPPDVDPNSSDPIPSSYPVKSNGEQSSESDNTSTCFTPLMTGNGAKPLPSYQSNENIDTTPADTILDIGDDDRRSNATMDSGKLDVQRGENTGGSKCNLFNTERAVSNNDVSTTIVEADKPTVSPSPPTVLSQATPTITPPPITYQSIEKPYYSYNSVINCRYSITETSELSADPDHYNEDRVFFAKTDDVIVMAVFDGHDGNKASGLVEQYLFSKFINPDVLVGLRFETKATLYALIDDVERVFFQKINDYIEEKNDIQSTLPKGLNSYQASLLYPDKINRLQEIEPELAGGTTAVIAVVFNNNLYVANVGDSRAIAVYRKHFEKFRQLSVDHCVDNEDELERLKDLGLDIEQIKRNGRLGSHENTRSIGDYNIKKGYKDVDILSSATGPPGIATPSISGPYPINDIEYILLMSDGVYKTLECLTDPPTSDVYPRLLQLIQKAEKSANLQDIAREVLQDIEALHKEAYYDSAMTDPRSTVAVNCRKRDDMTLMVLHFS